jgi:hypothetical protein
MRTSCKSPARLQELLSRLTVWPWDHNTREGFSRWILPQDQDRLGFTAGTSAGRTHHPRGLCHEGDIAQRGPANWIGLNGRNHGEYFLLKTNQFHVKLDLTSQEFNGSISARVGRNTPVDFVPILSLEELVALTKPAVVYLKGLQKTGTGFLVSDTGVIVTNAHLARSEESLLALLPGGVQLEAKVEFIDADLDIALLKVQGAGFPHLTLADTFTVQQGETVFAIGNPGEGCCSA